MALDGKITSLTSLPAVDRANNVLEIVSSGASYKVTPNFILGITGSPVGTTDSQTLTNKTLTAPTVSSPVFSGTITGTYTIGGTPTFPSSVATLTGSQTLTNKTLTSPTINTPTITNASISADAITGFTVANSGTVYGVAVSTGNVTITGTLSVSGTSTLTGNTSVAGTLNTIGQLSVQTSTAPAAGGASTAGIKMSSTSNLGLFFGSGAPTFSAAQGSIYVRTDGSSTSTRLYVNTNGSTTWTNFTSAV